jgi:hypothetical protein
VEGSVRETQSRTTESAKHQILLPMAVGALFIAILFAGALLG